MIEKLAKLDSLEAKNASLMQRIDALDTSIVEILTESLATVRATSKFERDRITSQIGNLDKQIASINSSQLKETIDLCRYVDQAADFDLNSMLDQLACRTVSCKKAKDESEDDTTIRKDLGSEDLGTLGDLDLDKTNVDDFRDPKFDQEELSPNEIVSADKKLEMRDFQVEFNPMRFHTKEQKMEFDVQFENANPPTLRIKT